MAREREGASAKAVGSVRKMGSPNSTTTNLGEAAIMVAEVVGQYGRGANETVVRGNMAIEPKLPTDYYVYTITVSGVVRYIGKGKGLRL
jgi:hypothetical protein